VTDSFSGSGPLLSLIVTTPPPFGSYVQSDVAAPASAGTAPMAAPVIAAPRARRRMDLK
jgi:hypothetical protein